LLHGLVASPGGLADGGAGGSPKVGKPSAQDGEDAGDILFTEGGLDHDGQRNIRRRDERFGFAGCFQNGDLMRGFADDPFDLFMTVVSDQANMVTFLCIVHDQIVKSLNKGTGGINDLKSPAQGGLSGDG